MWHGHGEPLLPRLPRSAVRSGAAASEVVSDRTGGDEVSDRVEIVQEDHELCEAQIKYLIDRLTEMTAHQAFHQYPHAVRDRIARAIRTKGIEIRR